MGHEDADLGEKRNLSVTGYQGTAASAWKGSHGALRILANPYFSHPKTNKEEERVELVLFANLSASFKPRLCHMCTMPLNSPFSSQGTVLTHGLSTDWHSGDALGDSLFFCLFFSFQTTQK